MIDITNIANIQSTGILMVILGYFGYILKDIPGKVWNILKVYLFYSIETTTGYGSETYKSTIDWLVSKYDIFHNHIEYSGWGMLSAKISDGRYYIFDRDKLCMLIVSKARIEQLQVIEHAIRITMIGFNRRSLLEEYKKYISDNSVLPNADTGLKVSTRDETYLYSTKRKFESIYNKNIPMIKEYVDKFVQNESLYYNLGIVYKTGFLFYGPPGSGKSSIARAIASYLNYEVFYINQYTTIASLSRVMPRTVMLIEDLDCFVDENREDENTNKNKKRSGPFRQISFQELLNAIDGVLSPHNNH